VPRYILIDNHSGFIFGDTATLRGDHVIDGEQVRDLSLTPILAARWIDEVEGGSYGRTYEEHSSGYQPAANETAYFVYRADINGSDAVVAITDGQDEEMIEAVERDCDLVAVVTSQRNEG
jgi:hypothetical protein